MDLLERQSVAEPKAADRKCSCKNYGVGQLVLERRECEEPILISSTKKSSVIRSCAPKEVARGRNFRQNG